jgi:hypothetical protein
VTDDPALSCPGARDSPSAASFPSSRCGCALGELPQAAVEDFDRIEGMLLGRAIGNALGNTSEGWSGRGGGSVTGPARDGMFPARTAHKC